MRPGTTWNSLRDFGLVGGLVRGRWRANEDLMREHGILRRALLVYDKVAQRLQQNAGSVPFAAVAKTAKLFWDFGEDYHERRLEEKFIFPVLRKLERQASRYLDILQQQHDRGRELTDYVMHVTQGGSISSGKAGPLAKALQQFTLMYGTIRLKKIRWSSRPGKTRCLKRPTTK